MPQRALRVVVFLGAQERESSAERANVYNDIEEAEGTLLPRASVCLVCESTQKVLSSQKSCCGRYRGSWSSVRVGSYLPVGVRIQHEYPHVAATRCLLLRVFKPAPEGGIVISDTPATASAPPDPAHDRQSALRLGSHTPAQAPSTTPPSVGAVALGP